MQAVCDIIVSQSHPGAAA